MVTIPRNHTRRIAEIRERMTRCRVFTLDNNFVGRDVEPRFAWEALYRSPHAQLTGHDAEARYVIHVHSNCWYELTA